MNVIQASDNAWRNLGVMMMPRIKAAEWQPMEAQILDLLRGPAAATPWLPPGWLDAVNALVTEFPDQRVMIAPTLSNSKVLDQAPKWLDTPEKQTAWQAAYDKTRDAISTFSGGMQVEGLKLMEAANSRAWWDDTIYRAVKAVADAPATIVGTAGEFATGLLGTFLRAWWPVLAIAAIAFVAWQGRDALSSAASARAARAIKG